MPGETRNAILFSDIVGSTSLYEKLGNEEAKRVVDQALDTISEIIRDHEGSIVKYIGDEVMARFNDPDNACDAAVSMQEFTRSPQSLGVRLKVGIDFGPVIDERNDVFGNTVNVAARMASIATAGQIIITQDMLDNLNPDNQAMGQVFDRAPVRGKAEPINIVTIVWEEDVTTIGDVDQRVQSQAAASQETLELTVGGDQYIVSSLGSFTIGRGMHCDLALPQVGLASREHAVISFKRGKFVLADQSTNGTYVRTADGNLVYLRREEMQLWGEGIVCLGSEFEGDENHHIYYSL